MCIRDSIYSLLLAGVIVLIYHSSSHSLSRLLGLNNWKFFFLPFFEKKPKFSVRYLAADMKLLPTPLVFRLSASYTVARVPLRNGLDIQHLTKHERNTDLAKPKENTGYNEKKIQP